MAYVPYYTTEQLADFTTEQLQAMRRTARRDYVDTGNLSPLDRQLCLEAEIERRREAYLAQLAQEEREARATRDIARQAAAEAVAPFDPWTFAGLVSPEVDILD